MLFKIWEAFNSSLINDRLLELCGELSEDHIAGKYGEAGEEGAAAWKDVGIWSEAEWTVLAGKALGSMSRYLMLHKVKRLFNSFLHRRSCWRDESESDFI